MLWHASLFLGLRPVGFTTLFFFYFLLVVSTAFPPNNPYILNQSFRTAEREVNISLLVPVPRDAATTSLFNFAGGLRCFFL
jgi:hypothetical protein